MITQKTYTIGEAARMVRVETHVLRYWEEELGLSIHRNDLGHRFYTKEDVALLGDIKTWKEQGFHLKAIRMMLSKNGKFAVPREVVRQAQAMVEKAESSRTEQGEAVNAADAAGQMEATHAADAAGQAEVEERSEAVNAADAAGQGEAVNAADAAGQTEAAHAAVAAGQMEAAHAAATTGQMEAAHAADAAERERVEAVHAAATAEQAETAVGEVAHTACAAGSVETILTDGRTSKAAKLQLLLEHLVSRAVQENNAVILKELDYQFRQMEENAQAREQQHWEREEEHYRKLDALLCQKGRKKDRKKRRTFS